MNSQLSCDLARIKTVIESDRHNTSKQLETMLKYDLTCVLGGYFDFSSPPEIELEAEDGGVLVNIILHARRAKRTGYSVK